MLQVVKEAYVQSLQLEKKSRQLYLYRVQGQEIKFELFYRRFPKMYSLFRNLDHALALKRFECLRSICNTISPPTGGTVITSTVLEKVVATCTTHPNWLDIHISAYNGFVDFFTSCNFNYDQINLQMVPDLCTPLHLATQQNHLKVVLTLLNNGADPVRLDSSGEQPLHTAVKKANVDLVKCLLVFDADLTARTGTGTSVRHIAATRRQPEHGAIVALLNCLDAPSCPLKSQECLPGCMATPVLATPERRTCFSSNTRQQSLVSSIMGKHSNKQITPDYGGSVALPVCASSQTERSTEDRAMLISFDGGGIRGLVSVQLMIELSKYLRCELQNYFKWICGTSTGALIAVSLAKGTSLRRMRKLYFQLKDQILTGKRPYNTNSMESLLRTEFGDSLCMHDLWDKFGKHVLLYATEASSRPPMLRTFRTYFYPGMKEGQESVVNSKVWQVLRASTAAPSFFQSYPPYIDGGIIANNPTVDSLAEFFRYQSALRKHCFKSVTQNVVQSQLKLVVSFGNGCVAPQVKDLSYIYNKMSWFHDIKSVFRDLLQMVKNFGSFKEQLTARTTNCNEHIVLRSESWCSARDIAFFRINPTLSKKMPLNEVSDYELIQALWETKVYAHQNVHQLRQLGQVIDCLHGSV